MTGALSAELQELESILDNDGRSFEFVQAVRLLQRMYPESHPVGGWFDPQHEVARFHVPPSLAFPESELSAVSIGDRNEKDGLLSPVRVGVRFFGLTGPQGVLPHLYTVHAADRARSRDTAFRDFLDIFHHRLLSLFYRAWERHHTAAVAERGGEDRVRSHLLDFAGVGNRLAQANSSVPLNTIAYYAGLLAVRTRPAIGLSQWVSDYFGVSASVEQFVGEWRRMSDGGQVCLDADNSDGRLGQAVIGDAVYDPHARVTLRLGPLTREQFDSFLPGGRNHDGLRAIACWYADGDLGVDLQLVLNREEMTPAQIGVPSAPRLGFGTWLKNHAPKKDPDDVRFSLS